MGFDLLLKLGGLVFEHGVLLSSHRQLGGNLVEFLILTNGVVDLDVTGRRPTIGFAFAEPCPGHLLPMTAMHAGVLFGIRGHAIPTELIEVVHRLVEVGAEGVARELVDRGSDILFGDRATWRDASDEVSPLLCVVVSSGIDAADKDLVIDRDRTIEIFEMLLIWPDGAS